MALPSVHLIDHKDLIHWKWTTDGKYGQLSELKCRFFGWLTLHDMVLTADNLLKRNWVVTTTAASAFAYMKRLSTFSLGAIFQKLCGISGRTF
jgi:hypothetical protein